MSKEIPHWLKGLANESDLQAIEAAVVTAESRTAGEIVPLVVHRSSPVRHVPMIAFAVGFIAVLLLLPVIEAYLVMIPWWALEILALVVGFVFAAVSLRSDTIIRWFTPFADRAESAFQRAQLEFFQSGVPATEGRTGILIMLSVLERRAIILGDSAITARLPESTWVEIVDELTAHLHRRDLRGGFTHAVARVGEILAREFPLQPGDKNEIANHLIVKE